MPSNPLKRKSWDTKYREVHRKRVRVSRAEWKKKRKNDLLTVKMEKGGECAACGYKEEIRILHFHHLRDKKFELGNYRALKTMRLEAEKCILLCPNCHALEHLSV